MKSRYIIFTILCSIMIITCYNAVKVSTNTKNTSSYKANAASNSPTKVMEPSIIPITPSPNTTSDINNSHQKGSVQNTISPSNDMQNTVKPSSKPTASDIPKSTQKSNKSIPNVTPIKIPTIYSPTAPGKIKYISNDKNAIIDASNKNNGYIAIKYKGSNKKVKVQIKLKSQIYNYDLASNGEYEFYPLQLGNGSYSIIVLENISGTQYAPILSQEISVNIKNTDLIYLYPNQFVWFTQDSNVVREAAMICHDKKSTIDKISSIFKYVVSNISYDYKKAKNVQSGYLPNVDEIISSKKGICFDYAAVFAAMCRAQGIPTKLITGYVSPNGVYHSWNEVYSPEKGWITVSFYLKNRGYNLVDPTFYANMDDNKEASSYIGNGANYKIYHFY